MARGVRLKTVLDTNIVILALRDELAEDLPAEGAMVSVMTEIELLSYPGLSPDEELQIRALLTRLEIVPLSRDVVAETILIRRSLRVRLSDAIILASAIVTGAELWTNDRDLAKKSPVFTRTVQTVN